MNHIPGDDVVCSQLLFVALLLTNLVYISLVTERIHQTNLKYLQSGDIVSLGRQDFAHNFTSVVKRSHGLLVGFRKV